MRYHDQIVREYGAAELHRGLTSIGVDVQRSTPQRWADRASIPSEYWPALAELKVASLTELAETAPKRKRPVLQPAQKAA